MTEFFTPRQRQVLEAAFDALVPSLEPPAGEAGDPERGAFWRRPASALDVAGEVPGILAGLTEEEQKAFRKLLDLLASPVAGLTARSWPRSFLQMTPEQRERLLQRWAASRWLTLRQGFIALKKLACFLAYAATDGDEPNPNWAAVGYPGPPGDEPPARAPLTTWSPAGAGVAAGGEVRCQVAVVGSGAGGGLAAGLLAEAGRDIIVLEKGPYVPEGEMTQREGEMVGKLYEARAALATVDGGTAVFAGSCLGGGTTVNWTGAFRTPEKILDSWATEADLPHLRSASYAEGLDALEASLSVTREESPDNPQNAALRHASEALGQTVKVIPRNVQGCRAADECRSCGFCTLGCRRGTKRSTLATWLDRAAAADARIAPGCEALRLRVEDGRAVGVEVEHVAEDGRVTPFLVRAEQVVVAAGSIHTPALLMRSGVEHGQLGRNLFFHPTVAVAAFYPQLMEAWHGTMMSALNDHFSALDGPWGFKLETPPIHLGLMGMALPWTSGRQHKENMLKARRSGAFIVLTRDRYGGRVKVDRAGRPRLDYRLHAYDRHHLLRGVAEAARLHREAGAEELYLPHGSFPRCRAEDGPDALEALLRDTARRSWAPCTFQLFTAHQMGTCRMGGSRDWGPVSPAGRLWDVPNVWVADGSVFPSASGVNPMISIQGMAWHTTHQLLAET